MRAKGTVMGTTHMYPGIIGGLQKHPSGGQWGLTIHIGVKSNIMVTKKKKFASKRRRNPITIKNYLKVVRQPILQRKNRGAGGIGAMGVPMPAW